MNLNHYASLPVAQELVKAGIVFEGSEKVWAAPFGARKNWIIEPRAYWEGEAPITKLIPAPSLMELMDELPDKYYVSRGMYVNHDKKWSCDPPSGLRSPYNYQTFAHTAPDAAAHMLIKLRTNHDQT